MLLYLSVATIKDRAQQGNRFMPFFKCRILFLKNLDIMEHMIDPNSKHVIFSIYHFGFRSKTFSLSSWPLWDFSFGFGSFCPVSLVEEEICTFALYWNYTIFKLGSAFEYRHWSTININSTVYSISFSTYTKTEKP